MKLIVDLQMKEIRDRLSERGLEVDLSHEAREWLAEVGFDPAFGARPLRRALQKYVESPLSVRLLGGEFSEGDIVCVDVDEGELVFDRREGQRKEESDSETESEHEVEEVEIEAEA
jgi:ATP-dependent Clp protease ATP-binding subunit ClpC